MEIHELARQRRIMAAEYGPTSAPSAWFMFDNHTFAKLNGSASDMAQQIADCFKRGGKYGSVFVRLAPDGKRVDELCFHGSGEGNEERIKLWRDNMALFLNETLSS